MLDFTKILTCPYCGVDDSLKNFLIRQSGGYNKTYVLCPLCGERLLLKTLLADMSAYEWGEWMYINTRLFNSPHFKFYDKVHWEILFANLKLKYRMGKEFWRGFHESKEKYSNEYGKARLEALQKKYHLTRPKTVTIKEKIERGEILDAYFEG